VHIYDTSTFSDSIPLKWIWQTAMSFHRSIYQIMKENRKVVMLLLLLYYSPTRFSYFLLNIKKYYLLHWIFNFFSLKFFNQTSFEEVWRSWCIYHVVRYKFYGQVEGKICTSIWSNLKCHTRLNNKKPCMNLIRQ
jgi:hypothetical protein